jgi:hypothetical protein
MPKSKVKTRLTSPASPGHADHLRRQHWTFTPELEGQLQPDVPILREPCTADEPRAVVNARFNERRDRGFPERA